MITAKDVSSEETKEDATEQIKILLLEMITNVVTLPPDQGRIHFQICHYMGQNITTYAYTGCLVW